MAEAPYIVLRRFEQKGEGAIGVIPNELWEPVGTVSAITGGEAIKKISEPEGKDAVPGDYWAVAARYAASRSRVKTEQKLSVTHEKLPSPVPTTKRVTPIREKEGANA